MHIPQLACLGKNLCLHINYSIINLYTFVAEVLLLNATNLTISDIVSKTYFLTKTNVVSFPAADMLVLINNAYDRVVSIVKSCDNRWQWDDSNNTDLAIATTSLVSGQQDYALSVTHLDITRVELKDSSGNWYLLQPIDQNDVKQSLSQLSTVTGIPRQYDKLGASVFLYPPPNYSQTASLKVYYQRGPASFTSAEVTTGTKAPGFNSLYHDLIPLWASYDYALTNGLPNANQFMVEIQRKEDALTTDYNMRSKDEQKFIKTVRRSSR